MSLEPRLNAYRSDLADARLRDQVEAGAFAQGESRLVTSGLADLRREPRSDAALDAQLWYGEAVRVFDDKDGWAWIQSERDGYVGYTPNDNLSQPSKAAVTHRVAAPFTFRFPEASIKAPPLDRLPMGSALRATGSKDSFLALHDGSYVFEKHIQSDDSKNEDWAETALRFLNVPYLWGGRSFLGVDCSGLVQTALLLAGRTPLRDSDMLRDQDSLGASLPPDSPRKRGDLLFSPGHVVIALGPVKVVHANAFFLSTVREPFKAFSDRLAEQGEAVTHLRRPD